VKETEKDEPPSLVLSTAPDPSFVLFDLPSFVDPFLLSVLALPSLGLVGVLGFFIGDSENCVDFARDLGEAMTPLSVGETFGLTFVGDFGVRGDFKARASGSL
jgi:hypothetical protein